MPDICPTCRQPIGIQTVVVNEACVCNVCKNRQETYPGKVCNAAITVNPDGTPADPRTSGNCKGIMIAVMTTDVSEVVKPAKTTATAAVAR